MMKERDAETEKQADNLAPAPGGIYHDAAAAMPLEQKLPILPRAPEPMPFGNMRKVSGGR